MKINFAGRFDSPIIRYIWAIGVVAAAFFLRNTIVHLFGRPLSPFVTFYPAVMIVALFAGFWPGVLATVLAALLVDFAILPPVGHFAVVSAADAISVGFFIAMGLLMSGIVRQYRRNEQSLAASENQLALLDAQQRLVQSESEFRLLANSIPQLCWMADPDGWITWYNDRWFSYTGTTFEQMQGWGWQSVHDPTSLAKVMEQWRSSIANGSPFEMVIPLRSKNGDFRLFLTRISPLKDNDGKIIRWFGTNTDIDDQKQIEAELRSTNQRLDMALEAAGLGEWELDFKTHSATRSLRHRQIFGQENAPPEWSLDMFVQHVLPEHCAEVAEKIAASHVSGSLDFETQILRADGEVRWIWVRGSHVPDETGNPDRMYGTVKDITERKQAENALKHSEAQLRLFVEHAPAALAMFDRDMRYIRASRRWLLDSGLGDREVEGLSQYDLFPKIPENRREAIRRGLAGEVVKSEGDVLQLADGRLRWIRWEIRPWQDPSGEIGGILFFGEDITERRRVETALRENKERLDLAIRVADIGLWDLDLQTHEVSASQRHLEIFGYKSMQPELNFEGFLGHVLPEFQRLIVDRIQSANSGEEWDAEVQILRVDGELRWIWIRGMCLVDESDKPLRMTGTVMDITDRKRAEQALKDSEAQLRLFVEHVPVALAMFDLEMRYLVASRRWITDFDLEERTLRGVSHYEIFPEIPERWKDIHRRAFAGEMVKSDEDFFLRPDGSSQFLRWEVLPWRDGAGEIGGILIFSEDITERKLTERKLQQLTRTYAVLSDINQTVVREKDSQRMLQAACDIAVDRGLFRMAWIAMIDPATRDLKPVAHGGNYDRYLENNRINVDSKQSATGPAAWCVRSGNHAVCNDIENDPNDLPWRSEAIKRGYRSSAGLPIKRHGEVIGVFGLYSAEPGFFNEQELSVLDEMALDISYALEVNQHEVERQKIENELRWRTAFFEAQLESSPDGILVTDEHGDVIYKNRRFVQMWNMPEELLANGMGPQRRAFAVMRVRAPYDYAESTNRIFASSDWAGHEEVAFLDGTVLTRFTSPVNDASGKHYGRIWVYQDITKRRQMEQQIRQSQKMEAVGQLTGGIAHDFNNLLGVILGNLDLLHLLVAENKPALRRVETAQKAAERGADVTRRLLAFSRSGELKPELTHLHLSVREVVDLARTLGPDIKFSTHFDESVGPVLVDTTGLESALLNLLVNARDAMPNGGKVTISTELRILDESHPLVEIGELANTTYACISVTDTGSGMSTETLNRVFEPFFTTKSEGKGTGLGLAMVYGFVKQSGGAVRIYSEEGIGTTVTIYLPLAEAIPARPTAAAVTPRPLPSLSKVLVVDDEPDLLEISRVYLQQMGYKVYEANDADAALAIARHNTDIDLMITDIIMPGGVNGVELANNIRELLPHIRIIYTSGFPANAMADRGLPGINGPMLRKPYHLAEFEAAIRTVME